VASRRAEGWRGMSDYDCHCVGESIADGLACVTWSTTCDDCGATGELTRWLWADSPDSESRRAARGEVIPEQRGPAPEGSLRAAETSWGADAATGAEILASARANPGVVDALIDGLLDTRPV